MNKNYLLIGTFLCFCSVLLGAFGAHKLKQMLSEKSLTNFETAVRYITISGLSMLIINTFKFIPKPSISIINRLFLFGTLLFSGSIILLSTDLISASYIWFITPLGGLLLLLGWGLLFFEIYKSNPQ